MNQNDTSKDAQKVLLGIYRQMPVAMKMSRIFQAYQMGKMLAIAGLKQLHPDAGEKQIWYLWAKQHLGEELFNKAYEGVSNE